MACIESNTLFKGFSLELVEANATIGITNTFGDAIANATIRVDCGFGIEEDLSDEFGCASFNIPADVSCTIEVEKDCFHLYNGIFQAVSVNDFDVTKNFPFKIIGNDDSAVLTSSVQITYSKPNVPDDIVVYTANANGIFEAEFRYGYQHTLAIDGGGQGVLNQTIESFIKVECTETAFRIIPIIKLN